MNRRGVTLAEVLVAIFVMALGLLAILSLFPLGAAQMAQALKDQRCAEAAANAAAYARIIWKQACDADTNQPPKFRNATTLAPVSPQRFAYGLDDPSTSYAANPLPGYSSTTNTPIVSPQITDTSDPDYPYYSTANIPALTPLPSTGLSAAGTSYPVYVDPFGWFANASKPQKQAWLPTKTVSYVGNGSTIPNGSVSWHMPRRPLYVRVGPANAVGLNPNNNWALLGGQSIDPNPATAAQEAVNNRLRLLKMFSLTDDTTFNYDGTPDLDGNQATGASVDGVNASTLTAPYTMSRVGRYSWAYLFRRTFNSSRDNVDVTIIVYSGRSMDVPTDEKSYVGSGFSGTKGLTITYTAGDKPPIRRGSWILDATMNDAYGNPSAQGYFYRVVDVQDDNTNPTTVMNLELQTPLAVINNTPTPTATLPVKQQRVIIVMDQVVEVFPKYNFTQLAPPMPY